MPRTLPTTIVNAIFAQQTSEAFLVLLTATHSSFTPVRVVNNTELVTSNGNVFQPFPFAVILPPDSEDLKIAAKISIFDAEREVIDNLRFVAGSRERIKIELEVIAASDPDTILQSVSGLEIENVVYEAGRLDLEATINNLLTEGFPRDSFTPNNFPGIF